MNTIPYINMEQTGRNINKMRQEAGFTVRELQEIFGFSTPQAIYKWQHGAAMPTIDNLVVLADVLGVSIDDILIVDGGRKAKRTVERDRGDRGPFPFFKAFKGRSREYLCYIAMSAVNVSLTEIHGL